MEALQQQGDHAMQTQDENNNTANNINSSSNSTNSDSSQASHLKRDPKKLKTLAAMLESAPIAGLSNEALLSRAKEMVNQLYVGGAAITD